MGKKQKLPNIAKQVDGIATDIYKDIFGFEQNSDLSNDSVFTTLTRDYPYLFHDGRMSFDQKISKDFGGSFHFFSSLLSNTRFAQLGHNLAIIKSSSSVTLLMATKLPVFSVIDIVLTPFPPLLVIL